MILFPPTDTPDPNTQSTDVPPIVQFVPAKINILAHAEQPYAYAKPVEPLPEVMDFIISNEFASDLSEIGLELSEEERDELKREIHELWHHLTPKQKEKVINAKKRGIFHEDIVIFAFLLIYIVGGEYLRGKGKMRFVKAAGASVLISVGAFVYLWLDECYLTELFTHLVEEQVISDGQAVDIREQFQKYVAQQGRMSQEGEQKIQLPE